MRDEEETFLLDDVEVKIVTEYPDRTVLIETPDGNLLLDRAAFEAADDDLDDLDVEIFAQGAATR